MNHITAQLNDEDASHTDLKWQQRFDALACGECSEDDFMDELSSLRESGADSAWNVVALLDQRYRRGQMPSDLFHSIQSKISRRELGAEYGQTASFQPPGAAPRVITERYTPADMHAIETASVRGDELTRAGAAAFEDDEVEEVDQADVADTWAQLVALDISAPPIAEDSFSAAETPESSAALGTRLADVAADAHVIRAAPGSSVVVRGPGKVVEMGRVLRNRYVLERRLGSGGMGTVFKALDRHRYDLPSANRHVAIKILHDEMDKAPQALSKLRREFYCTQALSHPNIVKVYELDRDDDLSFFTMELLDGELLSAVIERLSPLAIARQYAWAIIAELGAGLAHAHARNVVHSDLKPQNIMLTNSGEVRILDFGASSGATRYRPNAEGLPRSNPIELTPAYASCELLEGKPAESRDDLYALACVSYALLAGEHPFQHQRSTEARERGLVARRPPGLTRQQWQTLAMGLSWRRADRSISVREWLDRLNPGPAARRLVSPRDLKTEPEKRVRSFRPVLVLAVLLASLIAWVAFIRPAVEQQAPDNTATAAAAVAAAAVATVPAATASPRTAAASALPETGLPGEILPGSASMGPELRTALSVEQPGQPPVSFSKSVAAEPERPAFRAEQGNKIAISAEAYRLGAHANFAEIHVRRSAGSTAATSFVWWTEPSSAKAGSDYVPQTRVTQILPKGRRMASLFVRILPNASRQHAATFYVVIANPSNGVSLGRVARTAVMLPASS
jgi:serine/threonine protein kinase